MSRLNPAPATALVIDDEAPIRQLVPMLEPEVCRVLEGLMRRRACR